MIIRLALSVALVLTGSGLSGAAAAVPTGTAPAAPALTALPADGVVGDGEVQVDEVEILVPAVDATGEVLATPEVSAAQQDDEVLVADETTDDRVVSEVLETDGFQTLGVTWPADAVVEGLAPQVRTRDEAGQWSAWQELDVADDAPDAGTVDAEAAGLRGGTDALWVGEADAVQVSFGASEQAGPEGLALTLVDAPVVDATGTAQVTTAAYVTATVPTATVPTIITREQWGARAQVCTPDKASKLVGVVLHHTAGSNDYSTVAEAMQQIRGDQAYHIDGRGWCDIGYNFVIDKWGNIYEGRDNSLTQPIIGVHAGGFNTGTVGISMLGTYDAVPSSAVQQAVAQIAGWRLGSYGLNPESQMSYYTYGGENSKIPANTTITLPRVFGHRDVAYTACPGAGGYAALTNIRAMAASYSEDERFRQANAVVKAMYRDILGRTVDASGLTTWSGLLASGSGLPALVDELTSSDEYIRMRITAAYRQVLGRAPEPGGMDFWHSEIRAGRATVDDVTRTFLSSDEFRDRSGGTDEGYAQAMYTSVLGRAPAEAEVAYWTAEIERLGRDEVTDQIWFSQEAAGNRAAVYYRTFLQRTAEAAGREFWAGVLVSQGEGAVRIGIAGSEEYRLLALVRFG